MILLWGLATDRPTALIAHRLQEFGAPFVFLDQRYAHETWVEAEFGARVTGALSLHDVTARLEDVKAAYIRPYDAKRIPGLVDGNASLADRIDRLDATLLAWADVAPATIINRPEAMVTNDSKPHHARTIRSSGFLTPPTLITNDRTALRTFQAEHGDLIFKSASGIRSIVKRLLPCDVRRLEKLEWCPTQFQKYIEGVDVRVHVIGGETFAAEIRSDADDYRYAHATGVGIEIQKTTIPDDVAERCCALTRALGLVFSGIDLRRTNDDNWYCFEVNPSPGFSYYQDQTGVPIDLAVARHLTQAV
jgi:glutathione synthase/RimK-type ligase-like ATP-grasp enzyme